MSQPEQNPFAPPRTVDTTGGGSALGTFSADVTHDPEALRAALERLDRHLADRASARADEELAGPRYRTRSFVCAGLCALSVVTAAVGFSSRDLVAVGVLGVTAGIICLILALVFFIQDVRLVERAQATDAPAAMTAFFRALMSGRWGYVLAELCPDARDARVPVPQMPPVETDAGEHAMNDPRTIREWARGWAVAGKGQVRWMRIKGMQLVGTSGRVARVRATVEFQSWPQWANIVSVVLFVLVRLIGIIVAAVLYYTMRRRVTVTTTKTLLQGSNGQWYLYMADLYDGAR